MPSKKPGQEPGQPHDGGLGTKQKAAILTPLAVLSAAWTLSLLTTPSAVGSDPQPSRLPDGSLVPTEAIQTPASVSSERRVESTRKVLRTASVTGIPAAAIAAYQRAETVINAADPACHLPWELVAAIGRVESDHGRYGGNVLDDDGVARPGIYGMRLDGTRGTARISDSDAGELDHDVRFDRAVGPMQFIPSTWRVVGVDADGDGDRNPQDIDDAALGTAVYLCAGTDDLATDAGRRASIFRYNHSQDYVDLVLAIMAAYQQGQFTSVPNGITTTTVLVPDVTYQGPDDGNGDGQGNQPGDGDGTPQVGDPVDDPTDTTGDPSDDPSDDPTQDPTLDPTLGPDDPTDDPTSLPTQLPTELPTELPTDVTSTADDVLTEAEALAQCLADGVVDDPLTAVNELTECVTDLLDG